MSKPFEIKNFRVKNIGSFPSLKAEFTVAFNKLELNKFMLMVNRNGDLYVNEPTDKPYTNGDGKTIYPKFYFLSQDLKDQIAEDAIELLHKHDVQTANNAMGGGMNQGGFDEPVFDPNSEIPFKYYQECRIAR
jgi:hypothetical protein